MKILKKTLILIISLSVFAFTASAHCGSCETDKTHDDSHAEVTQHDEHAEHHESDKDENHAKHEDTDHHDEHGDEDHEHHD